MNRKVDGSILLAMIRKLQGNRRFFSESLIYSDKFIFPVSISHRNFKLTSDQMIFYTNLNVNYTAQLSDEYRAIEIYLFLSIGYANPVIIIHSKVFVLRKKVTHRIPRPGARFYICSLSPDVIVYKGQLTSTQVWTYFSDLDVSY